MMASAWTQPSLACQSDFLNWAQKMVDAEPWRSSIGSSGIRGTARRASREAVRPADIGIGATPQAPFNPRTSFSLESEITPAVGSNEGEHMASDSLAQTISKLVQIHPTLYYPIKLNDSHIPLHTVKRDFFNDVFCSTFASYNDALFDPVRLMIRYEKSLMAWREIVSEIDDKEVRDTLVMDYVHPVFVTACDLPNVFKDRLVRGCVKLATIAEGDYSYFAN